LYYIRETAITYILFLILEDCASQSSSMNKKSDSSYVPESEISENSEVESEKNSIENNNQNISKTSNTTLETSLPVKHSAPDDTNLFVKTVKSNLEIKRIFVFFVKRNNQN